MSPSTRPASGAEPYRYLDYNATAPLRPEARRAMEQVFDLGPGNASSNHGPGRRHRQALTQARRTIAERLGVGRDEVVFTGNGSEANLLALVGAVRALPASRRHVLCSAVEHPSVLEVLRDLDQRAEVRLEVVPVDGEGRVSAEEVSRRLVEETGLVSVQWANNELGTVQPVADLADLLGRRGVLFHCDAVQVPGRLPWPRHPPAPLVTLSPHKFGGPTGVGILLRRESTPLASPLSAGRQEGGLRGGTEAVALAAGAAAALVTTLEEQAAETARLATLQKQLSAGLSRLFSTVRILSPSHEVLTNVVNFALPGVPGAWLVAALDRRRIAVSHGSACASLASLPSHVLEAAGAAGLARCSVRVSMGRGSSEDDVQTFLEQARLAVQEIVSAGAPD